MFKRLRRDTFAHSLKGRISFSEDSFRPMFTTRTIYLLGPHQIDVTYEGLPIPQSPFNVGVRPGNDPSRVKAYGPGLAKGNTNQPQTFTIETRGAGQGGLALAVEGKSIYSLLFHISLKSH